MSELREYHERRFEAALAVLSDHGRARWASLLDSAWRENEGRPEHVARHIRPDLAEAAEVWAVYVHPAFAAEVDR